MRREIKYSMCWEDPGLVIKALNISKNDEVLSIASGGENVYAILLEQPYKVVAIDSNIHQLYLMKLKSLAIKELDFRQFCRFVGFENDNQRLNTYKILSRQLSKKEREFWGKNPKYIEKGIVHCGKFENYLNLFRKLVLRFVLSKKQINEYLQLKSLEKQKKFFENNWDGKLWKSLFSVFFSGIAMKCIGRDKSYFTHNKVESVSKNYYLKSKHGITNIPVKNNFFMQMILKGKISIPFKNHPYLDESNYIKLKGMIDRIEYVNESLLKYLSRTKTQFSKYNLSDIFEKGTQEQYEETIAKIVSLSPRGSRICYWNNMIEREKHNNRSNLKLLKKLSEDLHKKDRVFFYSKFIVEETK